MRWKIRMTDGNCSHRLWVDSGQRTRQFGTVAPEEWKNIAMKSKFLYPIVAASIILLSILNPLPAKRAQATANAKLPSIARVLGITVGDSTVEALEKRLGDGAPCTGGHPHGGRVW